MLKKLGIGVCVLSLVALVSACGTTSRSTKSSVTDTVRAQKSLTKDDYASIVPMKDYEPVQIVTYKTTMKTTSQSSLFAAPTSSDIVGSAIVYSYLMEEARKLSAHAIINVHVETERICGDTVSGVRGYEISEKECIIEVIGTALAIRYTNSIVPLFAYPSDQATAADVINSVDSAQAGVLQRLFGGAQTTTTAN